MSTNFLSYSRADSTFAERIERDLASASQPVWIDKRNIKTGLRWDREIEGALREAMHVLVVLSPESTNSENVLDEVSFAIREGKNVIPLMYKSCQVPLRLDRLQRIDFTQDYDSGLAELLAVLRNSNAGELAEIRNRNSVAQRRRKNVAIATAIVAPMVVGVSFWLFTLRTVTEVFMVNASDHCTRMDQERHMLPTGLHFRIGDTLKVEASGKWNAAKFDKNGERESGPDGLDPDKWKTEGPIHIGALVGKVGSGAVFSIGSKYGGTTDIEGELSLGYWDNSCDDNEGSIRVRVSRKR